MHFLLILTSLAVLFASGLRAAESVAVTKTDPVVDAQWKRAISNDDVQTIKRLLASSGNSKAQLQVRAETGKDALMISSKMGDFDFVEQLLALGADPESTSHTGGTPIMFAVLGNHYRIVDLLMSLGVDVNAQGSNGWSSMTIAAAKGYRNMLAILVTADAEINVLDVYRWTPLMRAVDNGHLESARYLAGLDDIDLDNQDEAGNTALHHAVANDRLNMIELLIGQGAKTEIVNFKNQTARQLAETRPDASMLLSLFPPE